jgi:hypothetical protein
MGKPVVASVNHPLTQTQSYLRDLTPRVSRIAHLFESVLFARRPWSIGPPGPFLAAVLSQQRGDRYASA